MDAELGFWYIVDEFLEDPMVLIQIRFAFEAL